MKATMRKYYVRVIVIALHLIIISNIQMPSQHSTSPELRDFNNISHEFSKLINSTIQMTDIIELSNAEIDHSDAKTSNFTLNFTIINQGQLIKNSATQIGESAIKLKDYHETLYNQLDNLRKKNHKKNLNQSKGLFIKKFVFYNSMSLIMICLLAAGLIGVILLLTSAFTSKDEES